MNKIGLSTIIFCLVISLALGCAANAAGNVTVYYEYLTDSDGYNYGADFFVDSSVNVQVYVSPYIKSQDNVVGDVVAGTVLLQPYEKHVKIGSFMIRDRSRGWSVNVGAKWKEAN